MARFEPGTSGNPKGRPTDHARAAALRKRILKAAPEVIDALIAAARGGDAQAGRALLVCAVPPLKPVELPLPVPLPVEGGLAEQGRAVLAALAAGCLPVNQATSILQALAAQAKLHETDELERRIAALEGNRT